MPGARTGCCLTRAELLEERVSSHLQSGRAGEAPAQGDVTGYHGTEARHGTTCGNRREEGGREPLQGWGLPCPTAHRELTERSPCPISHFKTQGDPQ